MTREERKGANEGWFRELNERLELRAAERTTAGVSEAAGVFEIVCECGREECTERIATSFAEYESVRQNPRAFILRPGHADPGCERVVSSAGGYEVVEKFGDAGRVAEIEDPRDDSPTGAGSG